MNLEIKIYCRCNGHLSLDTSLRMHVTNTSKYQFRI